MDGVAKGLNEAWDRREGEGNTASGGSAHDGHADMLLRRLPTPCDGWED